MGFMKRPQKKILKFLSCELNNMYQPSTARIFCQFTTGRKHKEANISITQY